MHGVVAGPAQQRIVTSATVKMIAPAEPRDGIVCRCTLEVGIVQSVPIMFAIS
jgi:hypothetical protein